MCRDPVAQIASLDPFHGEEVAAVHLADFVDRDDVRVTAAMGWIRSHYTLEENPGMGEEGLYYYYAMFAKALDAFDKLGA